MKPNDNHDSKRGCVDEHEEISGPYVIYTLRGDEQAVRDRVEKLFQDYHPAGYGTRVVVHPDRTLVIRSNSCD